MRSKTAGRPDRSRTSASANTALHLRKRRSSEAFGSAQGHTYNSPIDQCRHGSEALQPSKHRRSRMRQRHIAKRDEKGHEDDSDVRNAEAADSSKDLRGSMLACEATGKDKVVSTGDEEAVFG